MVGWYQRLNGHELEQAPGSGEGQGSLACCRRKESNMTERLNNNNQESYSTGSKWSVHLSLSLSVHLCMLTNLPSILFYGFRFASAPGVLGA